VFSGEGSSMGGVRLENGRGGRFEDKQAKEVRGEEKKILDRGRFMMVYSYYHM